LVSLQLVGDAALKFPNHFEEMIADGKGGLSVKPRALVLP
jgi:hypothetical protein